jgi:ribosomal protein S18 acetylase RimI-like enzyme
MVAEAVSRATSSFRGVRPFNSSRDLRGVAVLLEHAFREDLTYLQLWSRVPLLRNFSAYLWAASFAPSMPDALFGFVWEHDRRIVGNVTISPDESKRQHWLVSNVAVDEKFRRQGIGRQLMEAAITEARGRGAEAMVLNVRPHNEAAIRLYEKLGFQQLDTEMGYVLSRQVPTHASKLPVRRLRPEEHRAAFELARGAFSAKMKLFRPPRQAEFAIHLEDRFAEHIVDFFIGQSTERWGYFEDGELIAFLLLRAQRIGSPHSLDIRVKPTARGRVEEGMVAFALDRLARLPHREVSSRVLTSHHDLVEALALNGFVPTKGLTLMTMGFRELG